MCSPCPPSFGVDDDGPSSSALRSTSTSRPLAVTSLVELSISGHRIFFLRPWLNKPCIPPRRFPVVDSVVDSVVVDSVVALLPDADDADVVVVAVFRRTLPARAFRSFTIEFARANASLLRNPIVDKYISHSNSRRTVRGCEMHIQIQNPTTRNDHTH